MIQQWMIDAARDYARMVAVKNPQGHPQDWNREAAVFVASQAFPSAPVPEQLEAADEIEQRMPPVRLERSAYVTSNGSVDPEFDFMGNSTY